MKKYCLKTMSVLFTIFFTIMLLSTIFFNKTLDIQYEMSKMIIWPIIGFAIIFALYKILKNTKFLEVIYKYKIIIFILLIVVQVAIAYFTYASIGWDCGTVVKESVNLFEGKGLEDPMYLAKYQNNMAIISIFKILYGFGSIFMQMNTANYLLIDVLFNIVLINIAAVATFKTCEKLFGKNGAMLSALFIIPFIILTPYRIVPYTDTYSQAFPILVFYLFIKTREDSKLNPLRYFLIGLLITIGYYIKPTAVIIGIAILMIQILSIKSVNKENVIKTVKKALIVILGIVIAFSANLFFKNKNFGEYITKQDYIDNEVPATHFIMMGLNNVGNKYGMFYDQDCLATENTIGLENKKALNIRVIKQRLKDYGIFGYAKFLYGKAIRVMGDGTFYYKREGSFFTTEPYNNSQIAKNYRDWEIENRKSSRDFIQALWILIFIGLIFSSNKNFENTDNEAIAKLAIIGIVLFLLIFEARSRYLVNHLPFFIIVGTLGMKNVIKTLENVLNKIKRKEVKESE